MGPWKDKRDNVLVLPLEVPPGHVAVGLVPGGICRHPVTESHTCCHHLIIPGISGTVLSTFPPLAAPFLTQFN